MTKKKKNPKNLLVSFGLRLRESWLSDSGETNIIAIILIIIVVIAIAVIFRNQLTGVVNRLFSRINSSIDEF